MRCLALALSLVLALPAEAQQGTGPALGAASNFGQGLREDILAGARALGVMDFRDAVYWSLVETGGRARFDDPRATWPDRVAAWGATATLTVNNGHPDYDGGATPTSPQAVAGFARHAARLALRFPNVTGIEVGNEFNSENFVTGPLKGGSLEARIAAGTALLTATRDAVQAVRPEVRVTGVGVHSIPDGWLARQLAQGGVTDALVIHPYDTPVDHLARQIGVLRRAPGAATLPVEITEFGTQDAAAAPDLLLKGHCEGARAGVSRLVWYPLHPRGDGYLGLLDDKGSPTPVGLTYAWAQKHLAGQPVAPLAPDPFTRGCLYGDHTALLWGAARPVTVPEGARATDAFGRAAAPRLDPDRVLVVTGRGLTPEVLGFGPQPLVADSFWGFDTPGGFVPVARRGDRETELTRRPGQGRGGVPWTPYLGLADDPGVRLTETVLLPGAGTAVVHRMTLPGDGVALTLDLHLSPAARSSDGVRLTVRLGDAVLADAPVAPGARLDRTLTLPPAPGAVLEIAVAPGDSATGDVTGYRFTLRR